MFSFIFLFKMNHHKISNFQEYLKAHHRRMKEFGPRPYMQGDYPELPRHYPGVRAVYQWDQIDAVTDRLYYIPQRWTYHRDHLTLPTAKARRELPAQDIGYAASATLRGVVSYSESQRRAASQSPCRSPGSRRPPPSGSAVSRTASQGTSLTAQTRGRRQRPRTCLPRAKTPQPGEEQPPVQLTPLLPRKPPTGIPSRSHTPSSQHSEQTLDLTDVDSPSERTLTRNSNHIQRSSVRNSRPATATTSSATRRTRSLSRPSTAVSRRTRWSDIADDTESLNSSILELLQTISATDGKLKPLSPRADRTRFAADRTSSTGSTFSGCPDPSAKTKHMLDTDTSDKMRNFISNFQTSEKSSPDSQSYGSTVSAQGVPEGSMISHSKLLWEKDHQNATQTASEAGNSEIGVHGSWNGPGSSFFVSEQTDVRAKIDHQSPASKSASIDFGINKHNTKLSSKTNSARIAQRHGPKAHELEPECNIQSKNLVSQPATPQIPRALKLAPEPVSANHETSEKSPFLKNYSNNSEVDLNERCLEGNEKEDAERESPRLTYGDHHEAETASDSSGKRLTSAPAEKLEIPLSLSQTSDTDRSSGGSSSQAEYLLVSRASNESEGRLHSDKEQRNQQAQPELGDEGNVRGEESD